MSTYLISGSHICVCVCVYLLEFKICYIVITFHLFSVFCLLGGNKRSFQQRISRVTWHRMDDLVL